MSTKVCGEGSQRQLALLSGVGKALLMLSCRIIIAFHFYLKHLPIPFGASPREWATGRFEKRPEIPMEAGG
jgi:hypothetical protein